MGEILCDSDLSGIFYAGWRILSGELPYADVFETKPPGAYFLFALIMKIAGVRIEPVHETAIYWGIAAMVALFILASRMTSPRAGLVAAYAFVLAMGSDTINGTCPNYETWTLLPGIAGLLALHAAMTTRAYRLLAAVAGFLFALAFSVKFQGVFFAVGGAVFFFAYGAPHFREKTRRYIETIAFGCLGALCGVLPYVLIYLGAGKFPALVAWVSPERAVGYAQARDAAIVSSRFLSDISAIFAGFPVLFVGTIITAALATVMAYRKKIDPAAVISAWGACVAGLVGAFFLKGLFASGMFYPHHFVIALPGLCLLFAVGADALFELPKGKIIAPVAIGLAFCSMLLGLSREFRFSAESYAHQSGHDEVFDPTALFPYRNMEFAFGLATSADFAKVGAYLAEHTKPSDRIFVWDPVPGIYFFAKRAAPTFFYKPYFTSADLPWSIHDSGDPALAAARNRLMNELSATPPTYIVELKEPTRTYPQISGRFPALTTFIESSYQIDPGYDDIFRLWKRIDVKEVEPTPSPGLQSPE